LLFTGLKGFGNFWMNVAASVSSYHPRNFCISAIIPLGPANLLAFLGVLQISSRQ
jgi:hypothetical protein